MPMDEVNTVNGGWHRLAAMDQEHRAPAGFEFLPNWVIYGPLTLYWIVLGLCYRDFALPALANPAIPAGGLCGESKSAILDQVHPDQHPVIAAYGTFTAGTDAAAQVASIMNRLGLTFPIVIKPDIGCKGSGVRRVDDAAELRETLARFARGTVLLVQKLIPFPNEAGVFYSREPGGGRGRILSMTFKFFPYIVGDGRSTLAELIHAHPRAGRIPDVFLPRFADRLEEVPAIGTTIPLVFTGNHSKGAVFRNATHLVTAELEAAIEKVAQAMPDFHHGRVDLRFESLAALQHGKGFEIIEINGIGAEPIHMWDPDASLLDLFRDLASFYGRGFAIGAAMRKRGHRSKGIFDILRAWRRQRALIATYPVSS